MSFTYLGTYFAELYVRIDNYRQKTFPLLIPLKMFWIPNGVYYVFRLYEAFSRLGTYLIEDK